MKGLDALKRIRQETCPATYNPDFDKNECCDIIEKALKEYEMEHTLRVILENTNYKLVREKQDNEKKLKALEVIKEHILYCENEKCFVLVNITNEVHDLLKEVLL